MPSDSMKYTTAPRNFICPSCGEPFQRYYIRNDKCLSCQKKDKRKRERERELAGVKWKPQKRYTQKTLERRRRYAELKRFFKEKREAENA